MKFRFSRRAIAWAAAIVCLMAGAAEAQIGSIRVVEPTEDLADLANNAAPGTTLRLRGDGDASVDNPMYALTQTIVVTAANSPLTISAPGGRANRPDLTTVTGPGGMVESIVIEENGVLELSDFTLNGAGEVGILMADGAKLTLGRMLITAGSPAILVEGAGTVTAVNSVFSSTDGGIEGRDSDAEINLWQCTFRQSAGGSGATAGGVQVNGGTVRVVASLFETDADAPAATGNGNYLWTGSLINNSELPPLIPVAFVPEGPLATSPGALVNVDFSTDTGDWPGALNDAQGALISNNSTGSTVASIQSLVDQVERFRTIDFEGDARSSNLQVGADEVCPTGSTLSGCPPPGLWEVSIVDTGLPLLPVAPNAHPVLPGGPVAGAGRQIQIQLITREINMDDAVLWIAPQVTGGNISDPAVANKEEFRITDFNIIDSTLSTALWTVPNETCVEENGDPTLSLLVDGLAELILVDRGIELQPNQGPDSIVLDTLPPTLGTLDGVSIFQRDLSGRNGLSDEFNGFAFAPDVTALTEVPIWGPLVSAGIAPANDATLGSSESPQVMFNWPIPLPTAPQPQSFAFRASFVDYGPEACDFSTAPLVAVAGMDVGAAGGTYNPLNFETDAFDPLLNLGTGYLTGGDTTDLAGNYAVSRNQTLDTIDGFENLVTTWVVGGFEHRPNWSMSLSVGATDLAGNAFELDAPVEFWWLPPSSLVNNSVEGTKVVLNGPGDPESPAFTWDIQRTREPDDPFPSTPLASFRLWVAATPNDTNGAYVADSDWTNYSADRNITPASVLPSGQTLRDRLEANQGQTFLLTLKVADEAGNFQEDTIDGTVYPATVQALTGTGIASLADLLLESELNNFALASWTNELQFAGDLDTRLRARLWHNRVINPGTSLPTNDSEYRFEPELELERDFGSSTRVPLPPQDECGGGPYTRVEALFLVSPSTSGNLTDVPDDQRFIGFKLLEEGRVVVEGEVNFKEYFDDGGAFPIRIQFPQDFYSTPDWLSINRDTNSFRGLQESPCPEAVFVPGDRFGDEGDPEDGNRNRAIRYTFSAFTFINYPNPATGVFDFIPDPTPATFQWTVTPTDEFGSGETDEFGSGDQPILDFNRP